MKTLVINDHLVVIKHIQTAKISEGYNGVFFIAITTGQLCLNIECESIEQAREKLDEIKKLIEWLS